MNKIIFYNFIWGVLENEKKKDEYNFWDIF